MARQPRNLRLARPPQPALHGGLVGTEVECAFERLQRLGHGWHEIDPSEALRETAVRFLRVHQLRAADALQLTAAFAAAERRPSALSGLAISKECRHLDGMDR